MYYLASEERGKYPICFVFVQQQYPCLVVYEYQRAVPGWAAASPVSRSEPRTTGSSERSLLEFRLAGIVESEAEEARRSESSDRGFKSAVWRKAGSFFVLRSQASSRGFQALSMTSEAEQEGAMAGGVRGSTCFPKERGGRCSEACLVRESVGLRDSACSPAELGGSFLEACHVGESVGMSG